MSEIENIENRYSKRTDNAIYSPLGKYFYYNFHLVREREFKFAQIIRKHFAGTSQLSVLEIGAGSGFNLAFFHRIGIPWNNIYANELLMSRAEILCQDFPQVKFYQGDASQIDFNLQFDIVFQSTVFTSILDDELKKKLADKMFALVRSGGIVLWYDFIFDNPSNKDVRSVKKNEIKKLFPHAANIVFKKTTLAPPVGRRIGLFYCVANVALPFLRSHIIAVIKKI